MNKYIKIIGYKRPYNIKINNCLLNESDLKNIIKDVIKNLKIDYNSIYYSYYYDLIVFYKYTNLNEYNKKQLYDKIKHINECLNIFGLYFK